MKKKGDNADCSPRTHMNSHAAHSTTNRLYTGASHMTNHLQAAFDLRDV
jgi:hypothetical protein